MRCRNNVCYWICVTKLNIFLTWRPSLPAVQSYQCNVPHRLRITALRIPFPSETQICAWKAYSVQQEQTTPIRASTKANSVELVTKHGTEVTNATQQQSFWKFVEKLKTKASSVVGPSSSMGPGSLHLLHIRIHNCLSVFIKNWTTKKNSVFRSLSWNQKVHYRVHKDPPLAHVMTKNLSLLMHL
jgi:hypothetical protein